MRSIRIRLTWSLLGAAAAVAAGAGAVLYLGVRSALVGQFDGGLAASARALATLVEWDGEGLEVDFADETMPEFSRRDAPEYFEMWGGGGDAKVLERSRSLGAGDLPYRTGTVEAPAFFDLELPDGRPGRAVGIRFRPQRGDEEDGEAGGENPQGESGGEGPWIALVVARNRSPLSRPLASLLAGILLVGGGLLAGIALLVPTLVRRGLTPLARIAETASGIDPDGLDRRFPSRVPRELAPICGRLNDLLARLESAFERERRFTSDAAHELRTPIAEIRAAADVALRWPDDAAACRRALGECRGAARQMERLVSLLLALARCGSAGAEVRRERIDLADLVRSAWQPLEGSAHEKGLTVDLDVAAGTFVESDRAMLSAILGNLLDNAVQHTPRGGAVAVGLRQEGGRFRMRVANTNDSLEKDDLPHLVEPFWRKDPARSDGIHAGLGLTLVAAYAAALRFDLEPRLEPATGTLEVLVTGQRSPQAP